MNEYQSTIRKLKKEAKELPKYFINIINFIKEKNDSDINSLCTKDFDTKDFDKNNINKLKINNLDITQEYLNITQEYLNSINYLSESKLISIIKSYPINEVSSINDILEKKQVIFHVGLNNSFIFHKFKYKEHYGCDIIFNKELKSNYINGFIPIDDYFDINNIRSIRIDILDKLKIIDILYCDIICKSFDDFISICILANDITNTMLIKINKNYEQILLYCICVYKNVYLFKYLDNLFLLCDKCENKINTVRLLEYKKK